MYSQMLICLQQSKLQNDHYAIEDIPNETSILIIVLHMTHVLCTSQNLLIIFLMILYVQDRRHHC